MSLYERVVCGRELLLGADHVDTMEARESFISLRDDLMKAGLLQALPSLPSPNLKVVDVIKPPPLEDTLVETY